MRTSRKLSIEERTQADAKMLVARGVNFGKLNVCPGPRGNDVIRPGAPRKRGRHLYWYVGEFQQRPGTKGYFRLADIPTFPTETKGKEYLAALLAATLAYSANCGFCQDCEHWTATPVEFEATAGKCWSGENRRGGSSCQWFKIKITNEAQQPASLQFE